MVEIIFGAVIVAFILAFMDNTVGMGYGTALTAVLLIMGFEPLVAVPAILFSGAINGIFVAFAHHAIGNVNFKWGKRHLNIVFALITFSLIGIIISLFAAISLSADYIKMYIGLIIVIMGILTFMQHKFKIKFAWWKLILIGSFASFNKTLTGGGYGPLVTSGQILSGVKSKKAVPTTALSESFISLLAVMAYLSIGIFVNINLFLSLLIGALLSVPFAAIFVKKVESKDLTRIIGIATALLGTYTLFYILGV